MFIVYLSKGGSSPISFLKDVIFFCPDTLEISGPGRFEGGRCSSGPKVFMIYPAMPTDPGPRFSKKAKSQFPHPLPQLPTHVGSPRDERCLGGMEEAPCPFSLQSLSQFWNDAWGFPQVSEASLMLSQLKPQGWD